MQVIWGSCSHLRFSYRSWGEFFVTVFFFSWLWCGHFVLELNWKPTEIMLVLIFSVFYLTFCLTYLFGESSQVIIFNLLMSWIQAANHLQEKLTINCVSVWVQNIITANFIAKSAPLYLKQPKGKLANKILKETEIKQFLFINSFSW